MTTCAALMNSSFFSSKWRSDFFWDFCACAMWLHREQGCLPSNVLTRASVRVASREYVITMPTQATDWNSAQCRPMELTKAAAIRSFGRRESTLYDTPRSGCVKLHREADSCAQNYLSFIIDKTFDPAKPSGYVFANGPTKTKRSKNGEGMTKSVLGCWVVLGMVGLDRFSREQTRGIYETIAPTSLGGGNNRLGSDRHLRRRSFDV